MNKTVIALAILNEYLTLLEEEMKSYVKILDELEEKITKEPSMYKKQNLEKQRKLIAEEALMLHEKAMDERNIANYISERLG